MENSVFGTDPKKLDSVAVEHSNAAIEQPSELAQLFNWAPSKDWSTATDEEVAIAAAEAKDWLGI
jgi:hypothetical protein